MFHYPVSIGSCVYTVAKTSTYTVKWGFFNQSLYVKLLSEINMPGWRPSQWHISCHTVAKKNTDVFSFHTDLVNQGPRFLFLILKLEKRFHFKQKDVVFMNQSLRYMDSIFFLFYFGTENRTQDLMHAKWALMPLSYIFSPSIFIDIEVFK